MLGQSQKPIYSSSRGCSALVWPPGAPLHLCTHVSIIKIIKTLPSLKYQIININESLDEILPRFVRCCHDFKGAGCMESLIQWDYLWRPAAWVAITWRYTQRPLVTQVFNTSVFRSLPPHASAEEHVVLNLVHWHREAQCGVYVWSLSWRPQVAADDWKVVAKFTLRCSCTLSLFLRILTNSFNYTSDQLNDAFF